MRKQFFNSLASVLLPFSAYASPNTLLGAYQRQNLSSSRVMDLPIHTNPQGKTWQREKKFIETSDQITLEKRQPIQELLVIDAGVADKQAFYRALKPGVEAVEIAADENGVEQLIRILSQHKNLQAVHIISHAQDGVVFLGNTQLSADNVKQQVELFNQLNGAIVEQGDLLFYGCELASGEEGEKFLDIIAGNTHIDVAASNDLTGAESLGGDWSLEIARGTITADIPFGEKALHDFSHVLAPETYFADSFTCSINCGISKPSYTTTDSDFVLTGEASGSPENIYAYDTFRPSDGIYFSYQTDTDGDTSGSLNITASNDVASFELTGLVTAGFAGGTCSGGSVIGYVSGGGTVTNSLTWSGIGNSASLTNFSGVQITHFKVVGSGCNPSVYQGMGIYSFTVDNKQAPTNNDGTLTAGGGVAEPVGLSSTIDTVGEAIDVFDFTLTDGGSGDGAALNVSSIAVQVAGTTNDTVRNQITWRLNGDDAVNVTGTYNSVNDTLTFNGLAISVADGGNETYTINAYYNSTTGLTEDQTIVLSLDGDDHLTVGSGSQMSGSNNTVSTGNMTVDIVATNLVFTTQPAGSVSGSALTTQPAVTARDGSGNVDVDFTETITITEASAGSLTNNALAAVAGVATFTNLTYSATADQQSFTLTANDDDGAGTNLSTVDANPVTSDVVATKLVFDTQPTPTSVINAQATSFSTVPVVSARDTNDVVDTGYSTDITLAEVNGAGSATLSGTGDTDGNASTLSLTPSSGVSTFTGMQITYTASGGVNETFNLRAVSGGLTAANSSQLTSTSVPTLSDTNVSISGASGTGGAFTIGDTVTATWNNSAGGDNNTGVTNVTVDFSQFGGGAAVAATNSSDTWTATYTITAGAIDNTNRNISITATNASGDNTQADTTNATVDNIAPTVTDANISISGASGTGGTYIIGDTVTATWNNTAGGDNNADSLSSTTVNFSAFGGGSAVAATNSGGTWIATYTITAGAIDTSSINVSVTTTDNAGNSTTTADSTNATLDNAAPTVSDANITLSGASGTANTFLLGDTVTATWDNSGTGDNNTDTINAVTANFTAFGGGAAVAATSSSGSWSATYVIDGSSTNGSNLNVAISATDNAGNVTTTSDSSNAAVDNQAPSVSSVNSSTANGSYTLGENISIQVLFDQGVTVTGTPQLTLETGSTDRQANYVAGSGTNTLTFGYTVQAGDSSSDLDYLATNALSVNGGTIVDSGGNQASLTLPVPGAANSLGANKALVIDTVAPAPVISSTVNDPNNTTSFSATIDFGESVSGFVLNEISAGNATLSALSNNTNGNYSFTVTPTTDGNVTLDYAANQAQDSAGNNNSAATQFSVSHDATAPSLNSSSPADNATNVDPAANIVLTFDENVIAGSSGNLFVAIYNAANNSVVETNNVGSAQVSVSGTTLTLNPSTTLTPASSYYIQVGSDVVADAAGNKFAGIADTATLNFTVDNNAPVAANDSALTSEDNAVIIDVLTNDSDVDGGISKSSVQIASAASNGNLVINTGTGFITYTPTANYNGADSFTYTVKDTYGAVSNAATVTLNISATNDAPVANADATTTPVATPIDVDVAANDSDIDNGDSVDTTTLSLISAPAHGTASINNGQIRYQPNAGFTGNDRLRYTIQDQNGAVSNEAQLFISVTDNNVAPVANNDSAASSEDVAVEVDVLSNDTDSDGTLDLSSVTLVGNPANGSTSINTTTGAITYTPNSNYAGSDSFTYLVRDNAGANSNVATVNITLSAVNDAPMTLADNTTITNNAATEINVLGNDTDVDGSLVPASVEIVNAATDGTTSINPSTGAISYTPTTFSGNDSFSYRVQDNSGAWSNATAVTLSDQSFNSAPLANTDLATTAEDTAVSINVISNDSDSDGSLDTTAITVVIDPLHGSVVNNNDGTLSYTPAANYFGTDSLSYTVADNDGASSNTATVNITVRAVNDVPVISGTPTSTISAGVGYSFTPVLSDADNDAVRVSATNLPAWASVNTTTGTLSGTPGRTDEGTSNNIVLTATDGLDSTTLASFTIEVQHNAALDSDADGIPDDVELANNLDPDSSSDAAGDADGDGVSNLDEYANDSNIQADDYPPVFGTLAAIDVNATGLLTRLPALTTPQSVDGRDGSIAATLSATNQLLAPGVHTLTWFAQDTSGNSAQATQQVRVYPQISLGKNQVRAEGSAAMVRLLLNGVSPVYPLTVGYTLSGTADANDHDLQAGTVVFTSGETEQAVFLTIIDDAITEGTETLRVELNTATTTTGAANFGAKRTHDLSIVEQNVAPSLRLSLQQNGREARILTQDGGMVTISATVDDPNPGDTHQYNWSVPDINTSDVSNAVKTFDPTGLSSGVYSITLTVTDSNSAPLSTSHGLSFQLISASPVLANTDDSDGDGIDDLAEGLGDDDGDGQPNYLDAIDLPNVLNERAGDAGRFLVEADPGIRLNLGQVALENGADGAHLDALELPTDSEFANSGGFFNMIARDVPDLGSSVNIVIPQRQVIPSNPSYRKFSNGVWFTFVEDANNGVASAPGEEGFCPPPGSDDYTSGLTPGDWCVQLTIEDGGPNDADGEANGSVEDPGGVGQPLATQTYGSAKGGGGAMGWEILLLLSLILARYRRTLLIAGLMLVASQTQASDLTGWYVQTALGQAKTEWSSRQFDARLADLSFGAIATDADTKRFGWDLIGGWQWQPWLAIEAGYLDWGEVELQVDASITDAAALQQLLVDDYPRSGEGPYAGLRLNYTTHIADQPIIVFLKAGVWHWQGDYQITVGTNRTKVEADGNDVLWGLGASTPIYKQLEVGLQLQQSTLDGDRQLHTAIQILYRLQ